MKAHKDEPRIKAIVEMRVGKRLAEFAKIRREGILVFNKKEAGKEHPEFQGERKQRKYFELVKCSSCSKVISKKIFSNHKRYCIVQGKQIPLFYLYPYVNTSDAS